MFIILQSIIAIQGVDLEVVASKVSIVGTMYYYPALVLWLMELWIILNTVMSTPCFYISRFTGRTGCSDWLVQNASRLVKG